MKKQRRGEAPEVRNLARSESKKEIKLTEEVETFKDGTTRTLYRDDEGRVQMIKVEYPQKKDEDKVEDNGLLETLKNIQEMKVSEPEKAVPEKESAGDKKPEKDKGKTSVIPHQSRQGSR